MKTIFILYLSFVVIVALCLAYLLTRLKVKSPLRFLFITLMIIISPVFISYIFTTYLVPIPEVLVPEVQGLSEEEALEYLKRRGLKGRIETRYSTEEGMPVSQQRPAAGRLVKEGRPVFLIIGKPTRLELLSPSEISPEAPFIPEL